MGKPEEMKNKLLNVHCKKASGTHAVISALSLAPIIMPGMQLVLSVQQLKRDQEEDAPQGWGTYTCQT